MLVNQRIRGRHYADLLVQGTRSARFSRTITGRETRVQVMDGRKSVDSWFGGCWPADGGGFPARMGVEVNRRRKEGSFNASPR